MSNYYKFYSKKCGIYSSPEKNNINIRYYESSSIEDIDEIIKRHKLEYKSGKEIEFFLNFNNINFEKLLKFSIIFNDWYLYKSDQVMGTTVYLL